MTRRTWTALVVLVAFSAMPSMAFAKLKSTKRSAAPCVSELIMPALNVRALQTELMVAALSCGEAERYNAFVETRRDELLTYTKRLQDTFKGRTNAFVTKLANNSAQNMDCSAAGRLFEALLSADRPQLESVASNEWAFSRHGYRVCKKRIRS